MGKEYLAYYKTGHTIVLIKIFFLLKCAAVFHWNDHIRPTDYLKKTAWEYPD